MRSHVRPTVPLEFPSTATRSRVRRICSVVEVGLVGVSFSVALSCWLAQPGTARFERASLAVLGLFAAASCTELRVNRGSVVASISTSALEVRASRGKTEVVPMSRVRSASLRGSRIVLVLETSEEVSIGLYHLTNRERHELLDALNSSIRGE